MDREGVAYMNAAAPAEDNNNSKQRVVNKHYNIQLTVVVKRGKEEMEFVNKEADRMHNLISSDKEIAWAKARLEKLHELVLIPSSDEIKTQLKDKLSKEDDQD